MSCYFFNGQELLQKAKDIYHNGGKERASKYYIENKDVLKENAKIKCRNLHAEEREAKENTQELEIETIQKMKKQAKRVSKKLSGVKKVYFFLYDKIISEKTIKFGDTES